MREGRGIWKKSLCQYASFKIWTYVATIGHNVVLSGKYACTVQLYSNKYIKNCRNPNTNLLSANYGVNQLGGFQMPLHSRMTSWHNCDLIMLQPHSKLYPWLYQVLVRCDVSDTTLIIWQVLDLVRYITHQPYSCKVFWKREGVVLSSMSSLCIHRYYSVSLVDLVLVNRYMLILKIC